MDTVNRFFSYKKPVQAIIIAIFLLSILLIMEVSALLVAFSLPYMGITNNNRLFNTYKRQFHPLFTGKQLRLKKTGALKKKSWQEYDPWFGYRISHLLKKGPYATDKLGFISNGDINRDISKKAPGTYRIFMVGGSTVAGSGTGSPKKSIPAYLERMLNSEESNLKFQVINAGVLGWYSPHETALSQFELLYYKPDMIISFDGVNDRDISDYKVSTWKNKKLERYYWSPYQEKLKETLKDQKLSMKLFKNAWAYSAYNPAHYLYSFHLAFYGIPRLLDAKVLKAKIRKKFRKMRRKYKILPKPKENLGIWKKVITIKRWEDVERLEKLPASSNTVFTNRLVQNLKNLKAICQANSVKYMAILQPTLIPKFKKSFSPKEQFYYDFKTQEFFQNYKKNYRLSVFNYYDKCNTLAKKEVGDVFFDFSKTFYKDPEERYFDYMHYTAEGNRIIASKIKSLLARGIPGLN